MESKAKEILQSNGLRQADKLLVVLFFLDKDGCSLAEIRTKGKKLGLRSIANWNIGANFGKVKSLVINTDTGWELTGPGKKHVAALLGLSQRRAEMSSSLRKLQVSIKNPDTRLFMGEAIECFEIKCYRAAAVLSWSGAVNVLYEHTFQNHLAAFNSECSKRGWKQIKVMDDFGLITEFEFLNALGKISVLGKNVREELQNLCLKFRNGCSHPNTMTIAESRVITHLELLINHVFLKF